MPGLLLSQAVGGDMSWESVKAAIFQPARLTPDERKTLADRMVGEANPVVKAAAEIATNPWVWAMFLATPVGEKALTKMLPFSWVTKEFSAYTKKNGGLLKQLTTPMDQLRGTGFENFMLAGKEGVAQLHRDVLKYSGYDEAIEGVLKEFNRKAGRDLKWSDTAPLDPTVYDKGTIQRQMVQTWRDAVTAKAARMDVGDVRAIRTGQTRFKVRVGLNPDGTDKVIWPPEFFQETQAVKSVELGAPSLGHLEAVEQARLAAARKIVLDELKRQKVAYSKADYATRSQYKDFGEWWDEFGMEIAPDAPGQVGPVVVRNEKMATKTPVVVDGGRLDAQLATYGEAHTRYLEAAMKARQYMFVKALGKEKEFLEGGQFVFDEDKLTNLLTNLRRERKGTVGNLDADAVELQGKELLMAVVGEEGWHALKGAAGTADGIRVAKETLKEVIHPDNWHDVYWMPRNTYRVGKVRHAGKWAVPPVATASDLRAADVAPWSTGVGNARVTPLTEHPDIWDQEFLERLEDYQWMTPEGKVYRSAQQVIIDDSYFGKWDLATGTRTMPDGGGKLTMVRTADPVGSNEKYLRDMAHMAAIETNAAPEYLVELDEKLLGYVDDLRKESAVSTVAGGVQVPRGESLNRPEFKGKVTIADLFERVHQGLQSEHHQGILREATGSLVNRMGLGHIAVHDSILQSRMYAREFADGFLGKALEAHGGKWGKQFIEGLREYGDPGSLTKPRDLGSMVAGYLYTTHLGLNLASALTNVTQPLLMAATAGRLSDVVGAWVDSTKEMLDYAAARATIPKLVTDPATKLKLIRENFRFANFNPMGGDGVNLIGIGPNQHDILDSMALRNDTAWDKTVRFLMSPFEKTEWMNRNFSAHLMERMYKRHGMPTNTPQFMQDASGFMMRTQFANDPMNTPPLFQSLPTLTKQFLSFPTRQLTGALGTFPVMGNEENYWRGLWNVVGRGMGMSAIVYETGKHLAGVDLSNGLFAGGTTAAFSGEGVLPTPPIISIPTDFIRAATGEDVNGVAGVLARLVPGGVALSRALGVAPDLSDSWATALPGLLQKTYVDWGDPAPTGEVPMYKRDGTFTGYHNPSLLIAKGMGVDLGKFRTKGELDFYLSKQAELTRQYKRQYLGKLAGNDMVGAQGVAEEYFDRVKVPLTVSRANVQAYLRGQTRARGERILDRLPAEVRPTYAAFLESGGTTANLPPGALGRAPTATTRDPVRSNAPSMEDVRRMMAAHQATRTENPGAFGAFSGY